MKKFLLILSSVMALVLTGCSKAEVKNEYGWYTDYNACLKQAQATDKKVILIISRDESDTVSADLKKNVLYTPEFAETFGADFEFCENDISPSLFKAAKPPKDADKETKKNAKKFSKILESRMRVVTIHGIANTPTVYVLSKQGYVIKDFTYVPCTTVKEFEEMIDEYKPGIAAYQSLIDDVYAAKGKEKIAAIDRLYEYSNPNYRYMMTDLMRQVEKLDKKNETGLVGKYVMAIATSDAMDAYISRKPDQVEKIYAKAAAHPQLTPDQRQQSYYAAAYVIGSNTPSPELTVKIIDYLEKAIEINPDSGIGQHCAGLLAQVKEFKVRQDEAEQRKKDEAAPEASEE